MTNTISDNTTGPPNDYVSGGPKIDDGGPAFPRPLVPAGTWYKDGVGGASWSTQDGHQGMSLRQYAAITLRVPNSGLPWLDAVIVEARRQDFAGQAMNGFLACEGGDMPVRAEKFATDAIAAADALIATLAKERT